MSPVPCPNGKACTFPDCTCSWVGQPAAAPALAPQPGVLTDLDRAILRLARYDLQYHRLRITARALLASRRPLSQGQTAVLTWAADELERIAAEGPPGIDYRVETATKP